MEKYNDIAKRNLVSQISMGIGNNPCTLLRGIGITVVDDCNRKCSFCPRGNSYVSPHKEYNMRLEVIDKITTDIGRGYDGYISLCGFGEPTLHPYINEISELCSAKCPDAHIILITDADDDTTIVSLPYIKNLEIYCSMYEPFSQSKIDRLNKSPNRIVYRDIHNDNMKFFNNRAGNSIRQNEKMLPLKQPCYLPFYKTSIDVNGDVLLCCGDWKREQVFGNVMKENLYDIWNCEELNNIRKELLQCDRTGKICERCDADGTLCGENIIEKWKCIYGYM